jgi:zinc protease
MKKITVLAVAVATLLAGAAVAGPKAELPKELPPFAPDRPLPVPKIEKKTLANGLEVWVVPRDGLPRVDAVLAVRGAGLAADAADASGFAGLLAGLLSEGTTKRSSREIAETAQGLGGSVGAGASADGISVYGNALASRAPQMLDLLAEIARMPSFPENEVRLAQANAAQGLKAQEAQPGFKAERALSQAIYGDHPYARTSLSEGGIAALTPATLKAAHAARFRPDRALLVVAGRITPVEAFRAVEAAFGDWKASGAAPADATPAPRSTKPSYVLIDRPGSVQSAIRLGRPAVPATDADYIPLQLAGTVLGGSFSSRLMQNLREDKGYTYGAFSTFDMRRSAGPFLASSEIVAEKTDSALIEAIGELRSIREPVPAAELEKAKNYIQLGLPGDFETTFGIANRLVPVALYDLPLDFFGGYSRNIAAVTAADVERVARRYLTPEQIQIVVVGDTKVIEGGICAAGIGNVERRDLSGKRIAP